MKTAKLNSYQVCIVAADESGKTVCTATENITAESMIDAYETALEKYGDNDSIRVYPLVNPADAESVYRFAEYARKQDKKWRIANDAAAVAAFNETPEDAADALQNAALAVLAVLAENPAADMFTVYRAAAALLKAERAKLYRISETEYNPAWAFHNPFISRRNLQTMPRLASLIRRAIDAADLTEKQAEIISEYGKGITAAAIMERHSITKRAYYCTYYAAVYKVLKTAADMDGETFPTFTAYGITAADVTDALNTYAKRARVKTESK